MSYYTLTEDEYKELQTAIIKTQLLPNIWQNIINLSPMPFKYESSYNEVTDINTDVAGWSLAPHALDLEGKVLFKKQTAYLYRLQRTFRLSRADLEASRTFGTALDTTVVQQITRSLSKEIEEFVFQGPEINGNHLTTAGLFNKAGNTSTFTTTKFGAASGPYETVRDMKGLLLADGFGTGKLDLITDTTLAPYFWKLPATDANFSEGQRIKQELLNGGNIYVSDRLPSATSNDGVLLLVENDPLNYVLRTPKGLGLVQPIVYDPASDNYIGRVEGFYQMEVYQPNAICKHMTVDIS